MGEHTRIAKIDSRGRCRLCEKTAALCKSHVIPERLHKESYDHKHRTILVRTDRMRSVIQKGLRELLLCKECEGLLNDKYEKPFFEYWYDHRPLPETVDDRMVRVGGFDYASFKLFHLSVLWRAHVASRKNFGSVSLGPYGQKIRRMLLHGDPGPVEHYIIFGSVQLQEDKRVAYGAVLPPKQSRFGESHVYYSMYGGVDWYFIVSDHPSKEELTMLSCAPQLDGTMLLATQDMRMGSSFRYAVETMRACRRKP